MNRNIASILAITAAAFAGQALAESPLAVPEPKFVSTKSRAEVQAELAQYRQAGENPWSRTYNPLAGFKSTASRDAVTAEYIAAREEVAALTGEDSGAAYLSQARARVEPSTTLAGDATANVR